MTEHVLELSAIVPSRAAVLIKTTDKPDGKLWEMRRRSELSLKQIKTVEVRGDEALSLLGESMTVATPAEAEKLDEVIAEMLEIIFVKMPDKETMSCLDIEQKLDIVQAFTLVCRKQREAAEATTVRQTETTTVKE